MNAPFSPQADRRDVLVGTAGAVAASFGLGMAVVLARFAFEGGTNGLTVSAGRVALMGAGLFLFCLLSGRRLRLARRDMLHCLGLGCLMSMMAYGNIAAVQFISIGLTALLFYTFPPIIAAIHLFVLRERMPAGKLAAVAVAFAGLSLMLGVSLEASDWRGIALALGAAVCCAWNAVWIQRRIVHVDPFVAAAYMSISAFAIIAALNWWFDAFDLPDTAAGWWGSLGVVACQSLSMPLYFLAIFRIGAMKASMWNNIQPVVSIGAAWLIFAELLALPQLVGGAMVLGGIGLMQWSEARSRRGRG